MTPLLKRLGRITDDLIQSRYLVAVSSALFLIIIGIAFYLVYRDAAVMQEQISNDFNQQQLILAKQAASQIDALLTDIAVEMEGVLAQGTIPVGSRWDTVLQAAYRRIKSKGVVAIGISDTNGQILNLQGRAGAGTRHVPDIEDHCHLDQSGLLRTGALRVDTLESGEQIVSGVICSPVPGADGRTLFILLDISGLVSGATRDIRSGKTGYAWVIDESGTFLFHPEQEFIGKNAFVARRERKPAVSFKRIDRIMKDRMLQGEEGMGTYISGWHRGMSGEITKLIGFTPVRSAVLPAGSIWSVAVVAPFSEVAPAVHRVYSRHFWAEVALIAGLSIFGLRAVVYHRRLSRSLKARVTRQQEYISTLLESSVDAIIFIDTQNRIQRWNQGAEMIFGYTADEMIGQSFHRLVPPELDADRELGRIQQELNDKGYIRHFVAPRITRDGRRITIDVSRTLVREPNGEVVGSTAIIKDITEKMEIDQRIYNTEKLASIGILAAGVAHEINNPLAIILGFTDLLLEKVPRDSPEYEDLKLIEYNANHAKAVVENMLGFARVTEGLEDTVDVALSINTVVGICRNALMTKKIEPVLDVADHLPRIRGDSREYQQVIFNLINNAMAAMVPEPGTLTLSARAEDGYVHVSVTDTGVGIPDKIKPQVFDPFFTTKKVGEGTGLGLSLCYGIVKKYGGKITFTSVAAEDHPGQPSGTTFTVSMPVYDTDDSMKGTSG